MTLVAICASFGSSGSVIGAAVAEELGVPFLDRAIPMRVADRLQVPLTAVARHDDMCPTRLESGLRGYLGLDVGAGVPLVVDDVTRADFCRAAEEVVRVQAGRGTGVILGRGSVVVLRDDPRVLRVRLDGPRERRIERAVTRGGLHECTAARQLARFDRGQAAYVSRSYGVDVRDPALYHLVADPTSLGDDACVTMIAAAARAFRGAARREQGLVAPAPRPASSVVTRRHPGLVFWPRRVPGL